ncbi:rhombosortase [Marinobacter fonticola]|uniref:rhombosortase n=1 Tax=Marinobacter fonticola TaxID=2603215 RepID=UPI00143D798E|nr:rhombosortase [Marinobacter fonticola]
MSLSKRYLGLAVSLLLLYLLPAEWLELQRWAVIDGGEVWRLVSAHWSHVGLVHLALNGLGVLVLAALFPPRESWRVWLACVIVLALAVSLALLATLPALAWYRGFSGCLYGLFIYEAIRQLRSQPWTAAAVLVLVVGKLVIDGLGLGSTRTSALIGAPVIDTAHVAGALTGAALALTRALTGRLESN